MAVTKKKPITSTPAISESHNYAVVATRWMLRLLVQGRGNDHFISRHSGFNDDDVLRFIGLGQYASDWSEDTESPTAAECRRIVLRRLQAVEKRPPSYRGSLFRNIGKLAQSIHLNEEEGQVLAFAVLLEEFEELRTVLDWSLSGRNRLSGLHRLALALGLSRPQIEAACDRRGKLARSGLFILNDDAFNSASFQLLEGLRPALLRGARRTDEVLSQYFVVGEKSTLTAEDFSHIQEDWESLKRYLSHGVRRRKLGMNVLIHGRPGVGKTEFTRMMVEDAGLKLHEVASTDARGEPIRPHTRCKIYQLCQNLLEGNPGAAVLFDEMEDILSVGWSEDDLFGSSTFERLGKAWFNRLLETNPVPTLWISNSVDAIDPAFLRRFDYVLPMKTPPKSARKRMLTDACQGVPVSEAWLDRMADQPHVTPAEIAQAAQVARLIDGGEEDTDPEAIMETSIKRHLKLQGYSLKQKRERAVDTLIDYDLAYLNPDIDPQPLVDRLAQSRRGTCLLFGPPGTGKTAFAYHLAKVMGRPLLKKTASDLLDKYVGNTEKNLAALFDKAARQKAVLLLDEADSFLRSREMAHHSWEITGVNELLVRMEEFEGVFLAATNFLQVTDSAALRRFDVKIRLDYLKAAQRQTLVRRLAEQFGFPCPDPLPSAVRERLARLHNLALGDFATLVRRGRVLGPLSGLDGLIAALEAESRLKPDGNARPMGFV
jgi:transitional endoplasmic reticulum ATPase